MKNFKNLTLFGILCACAFVISGCGDGAPSAAPKMTQQFKKWDAFTKEEKIAAINKAPIPEAEKQKEIATLK